MAGRGPHPDSLIWNRNHRDVQTSSKMTPQVGMLVVHTLTGAFGAIVRIDGVTLVVRRMDRMDPRTKMGRTITGKACEFRTRDVTEKVVLKASRPEALLLPAHPK